MPKWQLYNLWTNMLTTQDMRCILCFKHKMLFYLTLYKGLIHKVAFHTSFKLVLKFYLTLYKGLYFCFQHIFNSFIYLTLYKGSKTKPAAHARLECGRQVFVTAVQWTAVIFPKIWKFVCKLWIYIAEHIRRWIAWFRCSLASVFALRLSCLVRCSKQNIKLY